MSGQQKSHFVDADRSHSNNLGNLIHRSQRQPTTTLTLSKILTAIKNIIIPRINYGLYQLEQWPPTRSGMIAACLQFKGQRPTIASTLLKFSSEKSHWVVGVFVGSLSLCWKYNQINHRYNIFRILLIYRWEWVKIGKFSRDKFCIRSRNQSGSAKCLQGSKSTRKHTV